MTFKLVDTNRDKEKTFDTREEAEEKKNDMVSLGASPHQFEIKQAQSDGGNVEVIDHTKEEPEVIEENAEAKEITNPEDLSTDPIGFLESVNNDFVNTIKGKPAISKQGFRFIQREFEISTESEIVEWVDDPLGCVVWAKAELDSGYSAEAHGEGYQFESDVSDNEFVRYSDTRAKNRAISDLTSAGALAVSEMKGEE